MLFKVEKINKLINEGWSIEVKGFDVDLVTPKGKGINYLDDDNKKLPGPSNIALFLGPFVAVQIRDWKYFRYQFYWLSVTLIIANIGTYILPKIIPIVFNDSRYLENMVNLENNTNVIFLSIKFASPFMFMYF